MVLIQRCIFPSPPPPCCFSTELLNFSWGAHRPRLGAGTPEDTQVWIEDNFPLFLVVQAPLLGEPDGVSLAMQCPCNVTTSLREAAGAQGFSTCAVGWVSVLVPELRLLKPSGLQEGNFAACYSCSGSGLESIFKPSAPQL